MFPSPSLWHTLCPLWSLTAEIGERFPEDQTPNHQAYNARQGDEDTSVPSPPLQPLSVRRLCDKMQKAQGGHSSQNQLDHNLNGTKLTLSMDEQKDSHPESVTYPSELQICEERRI